MFILVPFSHPRSLPHTHRHQAHPGALEGSCVRWDQGCQMPNPYCISWVPLQWQATNSWAGPLPSAGVNGYHRVILLPGNPFYLGQMAAQCLFSPLILGTLAPTVCLLAGRGGGQLAQRMCCEFTVIRLLFEQFCSPRTRLHSGFISTQALSWQAIHVRLIRAQAARLVANTFFSTYPVLVQSVMSLVINTDHSFAPWSVASSTPLTHTHFHSDSFQATCSISAPPAAHLP